MKMIDAKRASPSAIDKYVARFPRNTHTHVIYDGASGRVVGRIGSGCSLIGSGCSLVGSGCSLVGL